MLQSEMLCRSLPQDETARNANRPMLVRRCRVRWVPHNVESLSQSRCPSLRGLDVTSKGIRATNWKSSAIQICNDDEHLFGSFGWFHFSWLIDGFIGFPVCIEHKPPYSLAIIYPCLDDAYRSRVPGARTTKLELLCYIFCWPRVAMLDLRLQEK